MLARLTAVAAVLLAAAPVAHAGGEGMDVLNGAEFAFEVRLPEGTGYRPPETEQERAQYFNRAHCLGSQNSSVLFAIHLTFSPAPNPSVSEEVQVMVGSNCDDPMLQPTSCGPVNSGGEVEPVLTSTELVEEGESVPLAVHDLVDPHPASGSAGCSEREGTTAVWAIVNQNGDSTIEHAKSYDVAYDTEPPPLPPRFTIAAGGEAAIQLSWEEPTERVDDVEYWQVLCAHEGVNGDLLVVNDEPSHEPRYQRSDDLPFGAVRDNVIAKEIPLAPDTGSPTDAGFESDDRDDFGAFSPAFICGEANGDATGVRIENLENNEDYVFILVAVDYAGNFAGATIDGTVTPEPAVDFWEDLDNDGSDVEGGFCLIADTYGNGNGSGPGGALTDALRRFRDDTLATTAAGRWLTAAYYEHAAPLGELARDSVVARVALAIVLLPFVALALAWHVLTLPGLLAVIAAAVLLRRMRRRLVVAAAIAVSVPATASAQEWDQDPYWDDEFAMEDELTPDDIKWHVGLKLGPYTPEIDAQTGANTYDEMFGTYEILPVLDIDRVLVHTRLGQLGVGGSIGFFGKTAKAFLEEDPTDDGIRDRSEGDETKLRIVPLSLQGVFRVTMFDDEMGIPLVPYVRGGLSYYTWWIRKPNGKLGRTYEDAMGNDCARGSEGCIENRALGASLGVQGTIGLSVRAERIDPDSAGSMRTSGIYHAGFYVELTAAKVDGFGSEKKLSVGDTTWFAGIDFEF